MACDTYMNNVCRACLTTKASFTYFIFENVCPDTYSFCTSIQVSKDEQFPKSVCDSCYELIKKYSEFKRTCLQSQATLQNLENGLKNEIDIHDTDGVENCEPIEIEEDKIKTESLDIPVKVENEEIDHDYLVELYHEDPEFIEEKCFETNVEKLVNLQQHSPEFSEDKCAQRKKKKLKPQKGIKSKARKKFIYTCDICQKKFCYKERFEAHKLEHEGKTVSISCSTCKKSFVTWSGLKRHTESEHTQVNIESLKCSTCGKLFKSRQTLKMHEKMHGNRRLIMCDVCGKGYTTTVTLRAHLETHKENRERLFTCQHCGKKFFTRTLVLSHMSRKHSGRRYICHICSYPFTDKHNLTKHLLIHDGKKPFKCEICNKSYATQSTLTEHKRVHSGERPYICNYCLKAFISKKRLTDHVRIHTGDKPHKCTLCEQRFTQRGTLKRHMKVHDRAVSTIT